VLQLGVPIAYPRMVFFETALESKTLAALGKSGLFSSLVNKFNADPELLDDLVSVDLTFMLDVSYFCWRRMITGLQRITR
jgi:hypothetical protein